MTREEATELMPIIQAYAEGKEIEIFDKTTKMWKTAMLPHFDCDSNIYRIKPEPEYRPFKDTEECWLEMQKHQPFGWVKWNDVRYNIYVVSLTSVSLINGNCKNMDFAYAYQKLIFDDGAPFGIKVEE